jgi:aromatic-L-amino-acid decarboxylase
VPVRVVCFRWKPSGRALTEKELDAANEKLIDLVNASGDTFMAHTRLRGRLSLRVAIGHIRTEERHVRRAWDLIVKNAAQL